jgi:hypothetical protein
MAADGKGFAAFPIKVVVASLELAVAELSSRDVETV